MAMYFMLREEALAKHLLFYYTGVPCKRGHYSPRYTKGGACVACMKEANEKYRKEHKAELAEYHKQYRKDNKERLRPSLAKQAKKYRKKYREHNREYMREYMRAYRQSTKGRIKANNASKAYRDKQKNN